MLILRPEDFIEQKHLSGTYTPEQITLINYQLDGFLFSRMQLGDGGGSERYFYIIHEFICKFNEAVLYLNERISEMSNLAEKPEFRKELLNRLYEDRINLLKTFTSLPKEYQARLKPIIEYLNKILNDLNKEMESDFNPLEHEQTK